LSECNSKIIRQDSIQESSGDNFKVEQTRIEREQVDAGKPIENSNLNKLDKIRAHEVFGIMKDKYYS
jgi:hypothetical protein